MLGSRIVALVGIIALAACAVDRVVPPQGGKPWKDADSDGVPLVKGAGECKYQAKAEAASATGIAKQEDVAEDFYDSCMRRRGY
jgi:hypothetical protein